MIDALLPSYLLAIGIIMIGLEALLFSFVMFFLGVGFIVVSLLSIFYTFDNGVVQIACAFVIAFILAIVFRNALMDRFLKAKNIKEEKVHSQGTGVIENGAIKFNGTYWQAVDDISEYKDGDKVEIKDIVNNKVIIG